MSVMIVFLDVGQGDGTLIIGPKEELMLIDLGSKKNALIAGQDAVTAVTTYILRSKKDRDLKFPTLDWLLLTHGDADHFNLWPELVERVKKESGQYLVVGKVAIGGSISDYSSYPNMHTFLLKVQEDKNLITFKNDYHDLYDEPKFKMSGGCNVYVISANVPLRARGPKNPKSLVTKLVYKDRSVTLTGDAEEQTEKAIIRFYKTRPEFLNSFALKLGHHGSQKGSSTKWIEAVEPKACFASADMKWAHPYCLTINRIRRIIGSGRALYDHGWMCGKGAGNTKEYEQSNDKLGFYTTMATMTTAPTIDPDTGEWIAAGLVQGVQYQLEIFDDGKMQLSDTLGGNSGKFNPAALFARAEDAGAVTSPTEASESDGCCGGGA